MTALLVGLSSPALVHAAGNDTRERAARKACLSGDYAKGVEVLSDLYIDTKDATYIFNQARCFEQNNRCEDALGRFREYLRKATALGADERAEVQKHIDDCDALIAARHSRENPVQTSPTPQAPAASAPLAQGPSSPVAPVAQQHFVEQPGAQPSPGAGTTTQVTDSGSGLRIAGIVCGVVGAASVGAGIYYYTQAVSYSDKVSRQRPPNPDDDSAGKRAETMQWVLYGAGAAALTAGALLVVLGWPSGEPVQASARLTPMLGPGIAGISAQGGF